MFPYDFVLSKLHDIVQVICIFFVQHKIGKPLLMTFDFNSINNTIYNTTEDSCRKNYILSIYSPVGDNSCVIVLYILQRTVYINIHNASDYDNL